MSGRDGSEFLQKLRRELLSQLAEADLEFCRLRMRVEQMESDIRVGEAESPEYQEAKGHELPQAEGRVLTLFRELGKIEDRIRAIRRREAAE